MHKLSKFLFFLVSLFILTPAASALFTDVASDHEYYQAISYLESNGTIEGYPDGSYRPEQEVNRAETLKIILLGSEIFVPDIQEQVIFPDVPYDTWYGKYVAKAKNLGIVSGDSDTGMFRPGDTINLAEILKILLKTNNIEVSAPDSNPYPDVPADAWFAPYFAYASSISLLPQTADENVYPATPVTRGLMAQLMYQLAMKPEGYQEGEASYYGEDFHGKGTASGEVFDASAFTAAHRTLPFDTWVRVRNFENGKTVDVRINDRGPYAGDNRIIDLSKAAFEAISPLSRGVIQVSITPIDGPGAEVVETETPSECPSDITLRTLSAISYENITLDDTFVDTYVQNEVLTLTGVSASNLKEVSAFIADESDQQLAFYDTVDSSGRFELQVHFPKPGSYQLGLLPGRSGSSNVHDITVLPADCLPQSEDVTLPALSDLGLSIKGGDLIVRWQDEHEYEASKITFQQGSRMKSYISYGDDSFTPFYPDFDGWDKGSVSVSVQGADLEDRTGLEAGQLRWSPVIKTSFNADTHYEYHWNQDKLGIVSVPNTLTANTAMTLKVDPRTNIDAEGQIILPDGQVEAVSLSSPTHDPVTNVQGTSVYSESVNDLRLSYTPKTNALHFIEINDEEGLAALNIPVYPEGIYPLIPNPVELSSLQSQSLSGDLATLQARMLELVNRDRSDNGLPALKLDPDLANLAQFRSDDMVENQYFSHWNEDGLTANDLRKNFAIAQFVSENIARDVNPELAEYGIMRSASHRANLLSKEWKRVGFGITEDPGNGAIFVQIFSDDPIDFSDLGDLRTEVVSALNSARTSTITLDSQLNSVAQSWSDRMVSEDFFDFNAPNGDTLVNTIRDAGITETLGTYIVGNSSFDAAIDQITANAQVKDSRWKKLGVGIKQDSFGIIKFTLVYTE